MGMGQQFCTVCGAKLSDGMKFCESCGALAEPQSTFPATVPPTLPGLADNASPGKSLSPPGGDSKKFPVKIVIGILLLLVLAAVAAMVVLPKLQDGSLTSLADPPTPVPTPIPTPTPLPTVITTTATSTPVPDPFPDAYRIKEIFSFNEGRYASRAIIYRYWMNETYHWHSDIDNKYYTEPTRPNPGYKYLLVFVNIENIGGDGYPYPKSNMIVVHNDGNLYRVDTSHYLPDKSADADATPIEIEELTHQSDYFNQEFVEDYGYSHGTTQDFVYPGQGNAIDGYLIYKVPVSLKPEETYVEIVFDGQDRAVWKLA